MHDNLIDAWSTIFGGLSTLSTEGLTHPHPNNEKVSCVYFYSAESSKFSPPSNPESQTNGNNTIVTWSHPDSDRVDYYYLLVVESDLKFQFPAINMTSTEIIIPSLNFSVTLSAVDVCGRESEAIMIGINFFNTTFLVKSV